MRLQTPQKIAHIIYFGIDTTAGRDDEAFGFAIGRLYFGLYNRVLHIGFVDRNGCLP